MVNKLVIDNLSIVAGTDHRRPIVHHSGEPSPGRLRQGGRVGQRGPGAEAGRQDLLRGRQSPRVLCSGPAVPLFADDVDKDSYFKEVINLFIVLYTALYWEAHRKYGFGTGGEAN